MEAIVSNKFDLTTTNKHVISLVQAMLGAISPNFRMVSLANDGAVWRLQFVLESDNTSDREEIQEIASMFESLQDSRVPYEIDVTISSKEIPVSKAPTRVVYRRREA